MTDLERSLDDFGSRLAETSRSAGRTPVTVVMAVPAVVVIATAVLLFMSSGGGASLDVAAEARAALVPDGRIVHMVLRTSSDTRPGGETTEQWYAASPSRWRFVHTVRTRPGLPREFYADDGRQETAYAAGRQQVYYVASRRLTETRGLAPGSGAERPPGLFGGDADVGQMLASGRVHDRGVVTVGGRRVRRLVMTSQRAGITTRVTYDVMPDSLQPVSGVLHRYGVVGRVRSRGKVRTLRTNHTVRVRVSVYEQLPASTANRLLLAIRPASGTKITAARSSAGDCGPGNMHGLSVCP